MRIYCTVTLILLSTVATVSSLRSRRYVVGGTTNQLSATGNTTANVNALLTSAVDASNNSVINVATNGTGTGANFGAVNLQAIAFTDYENGTHYGGSTIGKVSANGTDTVAQGEANSGMTGNTAQTSAMQVAVALGAGKSTVQGYQQNAISILNMTQYPYTSRDLNGFGDILASVNTFGTLAQQQTATETGSSSLSVVNTYGEGSGLTKVNSQSDLQTFDLRTLLALGAGQVNAASGSGSANNVIYDVVSYGQQVEKVVQGDSQVQGGGGLTSNALSSALAADTNASSASAIFVTGDMQATVGTGTTFVNGSSIAMVNMQGNQGTGKGHSNGTGTLIDAASANNLQSVDSKGTTEIISTANVKATGNKNGTGITNVQTSYSPSGTGMASGNANIVTGATNGMATMNITNGAFFKQNSTANNASLVGMGMGKADNVSLNAMSTADAGNTMAGGTLMTNGSAWGKGNSSINTQGDLLTYANGVKTNTSAGGSALATGVTSAVSSNNLLATVNNAASQSAVVTGTATGPGTVMVEASSYLRRSKRAASTPLPYFSTISIVCSATIANQCDYTLSEFDRTTGKWIDTPVSNLYTLLRYLITNQVQNPTSNQIMQQQTSTTAAPTTSNSMAYSTDGGKTVGFVQVASGSTGSRTSSASSSVRVSHP